MNLSHLKADDEVIRFGNGGSSIRKIDSITPTGLLKVGSECFYPESGRQRGGNTWHHSWLEEATPEKKEKIRIENAKKKENFRFSELSAAIGIKKHKIPLDILKELNDRMEAIINSVK